VGLADPTNPGGIVGEVFSVNGAGKSYVEVARWYGRNAEGMEKVCMPLMGMGRIASAIAREDTVIDVCDFQRLSTGIAKGVLGSSEWETNVDKPRFHKGKAVEGVLLKSIDIKSAGFIDWVSKNGTMLDIASIGMAVPSQTLRGWLSSWTGSFESLWAKFVKTREGCRKFVGAPGVWNYWEVDFFNRPGEVMTGPYDVLVLDPPRLPESYSSAWSRLNQVLGGEVKIERWRESTYYERLSEVLKIESDWLLFSWTEGQGLEDMKDFVVSQGTLEVEESWNIRGKTIRAWKVKRS
jgi:hypothetical protein